MRSLHNEAEAVITSNEKSPNCSNLYKMIQGRFAGVTVMDGVPIQDSDGTALMNFNTSDIELVEVLKNAGIVGIYGIRASNGVIAFYSKGARYMQEGRKQSEGMMPIQSLVYVKVQREFYVSRYEPKVTGNIISGPVDDWDVLFWKPIMQTDIQENSLLRFSLSDIVQELRVVIQGVTVGGHPVLGVQLIQVQ